MKEMNSLGNESKVVELVILSHDDTSINLHLIDFRVDVRDLIQYVFKFYKLGCKEKDFIFNGFGVFFKFIVVITKVFIGSF